MARTSPHLTAQAQAHEEDQEKEDGKSIPHLRFVHGLLEKPSDLRGRAAFTTFSAATSKTFSFFTETKKLEACFRSNIFLSSLQGF